MADITFLVYIDSTYIPNTQQFTDENINDRSVSNSRTASEKYGALSSDSDCEEDSGDDESGKEIMADVGKEQINKISCTDASETDEESIVETVEKKSKDEQMNFIAKRYFRKYLTNNEKYIQQLFMSHSAKRTSELKMLDMEMQGITEYLHLDEPMDIYQDFIYRSLPIQTVVKKMKIHEAAANSSDIYWMVVKDFYEKYKGKKD